MTLAQHVTHACSTKNHTWGGHFCPVRSCRAVSVFLALIGGLFTPVWADITVTQAVLYPSSSVSPERERVTLLIDSDSAGNPRNNPVVNKINAFIKDGIFGGMCFINPDSLSAEQRAEHDVCYLYDTDSTADINALWLYYQYSYTAMTAYPSTHNDVAIFDLKTGATVDNANIAFHRLFSTEGYFAWLDQFWYAPAKRAFSAAVQCAESQPYCQMQDIDYQIAGNHLTASLTEGCYSHVARACQPEVSSVSKTANELAPFLNPTGRTLLAKSTTLESQPIALFELRRALKPQLPQTLFVFGKKSGKPFRLAVEIDLTTNSSNTKMVSGVFDGELGGVTKRHPLTGTFKDLKLRLQVADSSPDNVKINRQIDTQINVQFIFDFAADHDDAKIDASPDESSDIIGYGGHADNAIFPGKAEGYVQGMFIAKPQKADQKADKTSEPNRATPLVLDDVRW